MQSRDFDAGRNVRLLYAYQFASLLQPHVVIWVVYMTEFRGLTLAQVGLLETFFWGISLLAEVPTGAFSDRFGRKPTFALGASIECAGVALLAFADRFPLLLLAYGFWSLGLAFRSGNGAAFLYDTLANDGRAPEFARIYGRLPAIGSIAIVLGGLGGAALAAATSLQVPLFAAAGPYVVALGLSLLMQEPPRPPSGARASYGRTLAAGARVLRRDAAVRYLIVFQVATAAAVVADMLLEQPFLVAHSVPLALFGLLRVPIELTDAGSALVAHRLRERIGMRRAMGGVLAGTLAGLVLLASLDHVAAFAGFLLVSSAASLRGPLAAAYVGDRTTPDVRATVLSVAPFGRALLYAALGPIAGHAADASLVRGFALLAAFVALAAGAAYGLWLRSDARSRD